MPNKALLLDLKTIEQAYAKAMPMRELFALAKKYQAMPIPEVLKLLKDNNDNYRLIAVSILDWKARDKKTTLEEKQACYYTYIENHKWINNWGMVDRAAPYVVGGYLYDKDRAPLYKLAKSIDPMERRTAIVSTYFFIRKNDIEDTFKIAEILIHDTNTYVNKAVGSWIREAGKRDEEQLKSFLNTYATTLPRVTLRYAIEKLDKQTRQYYLDLKNK